MKLLITGANGYLGGKLAEILSEEHDVVKMTHADKGGDVCADITQADEVNAALAKVKPDAVLHLAAANEIQCAEQPELARLINVDGTENIVAACEKHGVKKLLYFSTFHVYGKIEGNISEETTPALKHPYGVTKLAGEEACKEYTGTCILRIANGIGAPASKNIDRWSLVLLDFCRTAQEKKKITLKTPGHQRRDFVSIKDIAQATQLILETPQEQLDKIYNVGSGSSFSIREIAKTVQKTYKQLYGEELQLEMPDGEVQNSELTLNIERIKKLGYTPTTSLAQEAKETLKFCEIFR